MHFEVMSETRFRKGSLQRRRLPGRAKNRDLKINRCREMLVLLMRCCNSAQQIAEAWNLAGWGVSVSVMPSLMASHRRA
jgi:hypothetical protein